LFITLKNSFWLFLVMKTKKCRNFGLNLKIVAEVFTLKLLKVPDKFL